ncbi:hypothetical protein PoB_004111300 [Plakobranchus ocellatus]|uniref:Uncharacterized protein n=1 Tax=Plakobranchus ocellatus TaxID=259542 RepID=A0AAV4B756_9GAST|nr:hypothetical protein PoB_004111300 [Plakobranchus ocellatus]
MPEIVFQYHIPIIRTSGTAFNKNLSSKKQWEIRNTTVAINALHSAEMFLFRFKSKLQNRVFYPQAPSAPGSGQNLKTIRVWSCLYSTKVKPVK